MRIWSDGSPSGEGIDSNPLLWDAKAYAELRDSMKNIPEGWMREAALRRIETLDCGNPDKTLASCDSDATPPPDVLDWQKKIDAASVDDADYAKALAAELQSLVCAISGQRETMAIGSDAANAIHIL